MKHSISERERIVLYTALTSLSAVSIDAMLPALRPMEQTLAASSVFSVHHVVAFFVVGMIIGELIFGQIADTRGRRGALAAGLIIYLVGSLLAWSGNSLDMVIIGRVMQGLGASGPKIAVRAMIRDQFNGDRMASILSLIFALMVVVPMFAPGFGQLLMTFWGWRSIFAMYVVAAAVLGVWFFIRHPETLQKRRRGHPEEKPFLASLREIAAMADVRKLTLATGLIFGAELVYLSTSADFFFEVYEIDDAFPWYFAGLALSIGVACLANGVLVERYGVVKITVLALRTLCVSAVASALLALATNGEPPLVVFLFVTAVCFFCWGLLFGNLSALAMIPLGENAGLGSSVVSSGSSLVAVVFGLGMSAFHQGGTLSFVLATLVSSIAAIAIVKP